MNNSLDNHPVKPRDMNILVCADKLPYPLIYGDTLRVFNISKKISKRYNIYLFTLNNSSFNEKDIQVIKDNEIFKEIIIFNLSDFFWANENATKKVLYSFLSSKLISMAIFSKLLYHIRGKVETIIREYNIDLLHIYGDLMGLILAELDITPVLFDLCDSPSLQMKRSFKVAKSLSERFHYFYQWPIMRKNEKYLLKKFNLITLVSPTDKNHSKNINEKSDIRVIPNGVDTEYFFLDKCIEDYPSILFFGSMSFHPNIDSVFYIYDKILPLIKLEVPNIKFYIVGKNPPSNVISLANNNNIIVTGIVDDIREYIQKASVILVPMQAGSGIKNKILEAMSMGKPVVTNPMGVEAFNEEVKSCLLIGEHADEIANHVINLLQDRNQRFELGNKGRKIVLKEYSWDGVAEKYEQLYMELLKIKSEA